MNVRRTMGVAAGLVVACAAGLAWWRPWQAKPAADHPASARAAAAIFEEITDASGVDFQHDCGDGGKFFFPEVMGSGLALFDYDRDGDLDLFVVQGMPAKARGSPDAAKASPTSRLYRQEQGGKFTDVTDEAGLADGEPYGMGAAVGDVNNDGWPDLFVSKYGRDRLFLNRQGRFEDVTQPAGIDNPDWGTSACFLDFDRDGWLDLLVTNYVHYEPTQRCVQPNGLEDYCHPSLFGNVPSRLFRNETGMPRHESEVARGAADGVRFRDVTEETGIAAKAGPGLGVLPADFNGDGWIDVYVANDAKANFLWINRQGKKFEEEAIGAGAAYDAAGRPQSSMGVAAGDLDGDGGRDLFMTHLDGEYSTLYRQVAEGVFEDRTVAAGLASPTIPYTGFGTALCDLDLDGDLDLPIVNGRVRRRDEDRSIPREPIAFWRAYAERNLLFLGEGGGTFQEVAPGRDAFLAAPHVARGLAVGDLDNDGDLDLATSEVNGPARIFKNVAPRQGSWLLVQAIDARFGGRDALGAVVTVVAGERRWLRDINPAFSYLSSSDPRAHFGLGAIESFDAIEVRWPDGSSERFPGGKANRSLTLARGEGESL